MISRSPEAELAPAFLRIALGEISAAAELEPRGVEVAARVELANRAQEGLIEEIKTLPPSAQAAILADIRETLDVHAVDRLEAELTTARIARIAGLWSRWGSMLLGRAFGLGAVAEHLLALAEALDAGKARQVAAELRALAGELGLDLPEILK